MIKRPVGDIQRVREKESRNTIQRVAYRTEILMVGIIDVDLHQMRTWNGLRPDYANDLSTRGCENDGSIVELSTIAALPVIRNRSGNTGFYLSSELEVNGWFRSSASGLGAPHQLNYQWLDQAILFY